jgi:hypothetical protein
MGAEYSWTPNKAHALDGAARCLETRRWTNEPRRGDGAWGSARLKLIAGGRLFTEQTDFGVSLPQNAESSGTT